MYIYHCKKYTKIRILSGPYLKWIRQFPDQIKHVFWCTLRNVLSISCFLSVMASQVIWYSWYMKIKRKSISSFKLSEKHINYLKQLLKVDFEPKLWKKLKSEFHSYHQVQVVYNQTIEAIPKSWKNALKPQ